MNCSRIFLAAGAICLAASLSRAAEAKADACPDLSGKFACPAVERYHQKAMSILVQNDLAAKTFNFSYDDGSPAATIVANGKRKQAGGKKKSWSRYFCRDHALMQAAFKDAKATKASGGSSQRINKDGDYEVAGPDGKVTLVCRRVKPAP